MWEQGAPRGSLGVAAFGGIFRDFTGNSLGCFAGSIGLASSLDAELRAVIHVVPLAWDKGWHSLWIECDSSLVVHLLSSSSPSLTSIPWRLLVSWHNCRVLLSSM